MIAKQKLTYHHHHHQALIPITRVGYMNLMFLFGPMQSNNISQIKCLKVILTVSIQAFLVLALPVEIPVTSKQSILVTVASMALRCCIRVYCDF